MEIQQFVEEIDFNELLFSEVVGRGAFGVVHRALWRGANVAVKLIETESERKAFITELKQLSRISHPNIVRLYGACTKQPVCLVMEFAEGGSLYNALHCAGPQLVYTAAHALSWALQCARGVEYLHGLKPKPLIHRDLKPPNLLLVNFGTKVKICDFGTACDAHTHMTNNKGSAAWMAPEVFEGSNYSEKCDVFSWGVILWEIITRHKPFDEIGGSAFRVMWAVHSGKRPPLIRDCPKPLELLMTKCWSAKPAERPSMCEVVRVMSRISQFFKGENEPLYYPARSDSDERIYREGAYITPILTGHAAGGVDSRNSTVRETMRHQENALDGDVVRCVLPVTPSRKPLVIEDTPLSAVINQDISSEVKVANDLSSYNQLYGNTTAATEQPKAPVRTHRRTGSHGTASVSAAQQPFVPGHRRTGSHGNVPVVTSGSGSVASQGDTILRMTTAPGNLEDVGSHSVQNNIIAARSVSWGTGHPAGNTWTPKHGSTEDVGDNTSIHNMMNLIDPQLRPLPPCTTSHESVEIYNRHIQLLDDFMKLEAEVAHYEQYKQQLIAELQVDEKDRLNRLNGEYTNLLTENEQLKLLYRNLQKQVEQINQSSSPTLNDSCDWRSGSR